MENKTNFSDPCQDQPLQPNCPAVWKGDYLVFYGMHVGGILQIGLSVLGSLAVVFAIARKRSASSTTNFSDRFPLYIAITDFLWGLSHITDHILVLSTHLYPRTWVVFLIANTNYFCMGYQQLMYAGVALYTYLKIVRKVHLGLGRWDWKLHGVCFAVVSTFTLVSDVFGLLGVSRYWIVQAEGHPHWALPNYVTAVFVLIQAVCTVITFSLIKRDVTRHKKELIAVTKDASLSNTSSSNFHDTAEQCLTTFVIVGIGLYVPFAVVAWLIVIQHVSGVDVLALNLVNNTMWFGILVLCNASGFVNALAYFRNERIKGRAANVKAQAKNGHKLPYKFLISKDTSSSSLASTTVFA